MRFFSLSCFAVFLCLSVVWAADSSSSTSLTCTASDCVACVPGRTNACAAFRAGLKLMDEKCVYVQTCSVHGCSLCNATNISLCAACMEGFDITPDFTCKKSENAAGSPRLS